MTASVLFTGLKTQPGVIIPVQAIEETPQGSEVFTVENNTAHLHLVQIGATSSTQAVVTSGLQAGEQVVITGQDLLSDDVRVTVVQNANQAGVQGMINQLKRGAGARQGAAPGRGRQAPGRGRPNENIRRFRNRPVLISMIMVALILIGAIALPMLPVYLYPNLNIPIAVVVHTLERLYAGGGRAAGDHAGGKGDGGVDGVQEVDSTSRDGDSVVMLHFGYTQNMDTAVANMRDKVNQVMGQLPSSVSAPQILKMDPNSTPIMTMALSGNNVNVEQLLELANDVVVPRARGPPAWPRSASTGATRGRSR